MKIYEYILRIKDQASDKVSRFARAVGTGKGSVDKLGSSLAQTDKQVGMFSGSLGMLTRFLGPAALIGALSLGVTKASALSREFEQTRISFETMIGSVAQGRSLLSGIEQMAVQTPFKSSDLQSSGKLLLGYGVSAQKILPTLKMLGDISGGNAEKLHFLSLAYAQTQAAGRLMGQDLLQMVNAGFNPLQTISEKTGISIGVLKKRMEDGAISAQLVEMAFRSATEQGGRFFNMMDKQSQTMEGRLSAISEKWEIAMRGVGDTINSFLSPILDVAIDKLDEIMDKGGKLRKDSDKQTSVFRNLQTEIRPLIDEYIRLRDQTKRTTEENAKLLKLTEQIGTAIPASVDKVGSAGNIMKINVVSAGVFIKEQEDLFKLQNRKAQDEVRSQLQRVVTQRTLAQQLMNRGVGKDNGTGVTALKNLSEEETKLKAQLSKLRNDEVMAYIREKKLKGDDWSGVKDQIMGGKDANAIDGVDKITGGGKQAINVTINIERLNGIETVGEVNGEIEIKSLMKTVERTAVEAVTRAVNSANYAQAQ